MSVTPECLEHRCDCFHDHVPGYHCAGTVQYRMPLSGTGVPHPRCDKHWSEAIDRHERNRRDYPDSPIPPAWFDPAAAGERWDEDE